MQEEIFGPILPVLTYDRLEEAIAQINARPKPLALYIFSNRKAVQQQVLQQTSSGGVCVNDTIMQLAVPELPFGESVRVVLASIMERPVLMALAITKAC